MKKILLSIIISTSLVGCGCGSNERNNVSIQSQQVPGFNVQNFSEVVKKTSNPDEIEKAINEPSNVVNNLDLNNDGKVDFLRINEEANTIQVIDNDVNPNVTIATLNVTTQNNNQASMSIQGTPQYCGNDYSYHSNFTLTDMLLLHYLLTPHSYYHPYYRPYYHPPYYRSYTKTTYRTVNTPTVTKNSNIKRNITPERKSISDPKVSQRRFETNKSNDGTFRKSNFGKNTEFHSTPSFNTPKRSFGSSKVSFGGGRKGRH